MFLDSRYLAQQYIVKYYTVNPKQTEEGGGLFDDLAFSHGTLIFVTISSRFFFTLKKKKFQGFFVKHIYFFNA